jgi:hypothetical protein
VDQAGHLVTVMVPYTTDLSALVAEFAATGAAVSVSGREQLSGVTVNDFRAPVTYTITARDGSFTDYTVSVIPAEPPSPEKTLKAFAFLDPPAVGVIDQESRRISVRVPHGTELSSLTAVFTVTGILVSVDGTEQESGKSVNDFTGSVVYVVTAEDGTTADYTVAVELEPGTEKTITAFSFLEVPTACLIQDDPCRVHLRTPGTADCSRLTAVFITTGRMVEVDGVAQVSGVTVNDFTVPRVYTVTAEDGSASDYVVRVTGAWTLTVNEVDYDQPGTDAAEFVELHAAGETDLAGLLLVFFNGAVLPGQEYARVDLSSCGTLAAGGFLVVSGPALTVAPEAARVAPPGWESPNRIQNGPSDAVCIWDAISGRIVDAVSYNGVLHRAVLSGEPAELDVTEGSGGAPPDSGSAPGSLGRVPDGSDTESNALDFRFSPAPTPGAMNK